MKHLAESLTLGLAVLCASAVAPKAADWAVGSGGAVRDFGSVKDYRNAAVPVPAPTPSPVNMGIGDWYMRGDVGYDIATTSTILSNGGATSAVSGSQLNDFTFGGIGFGRYFTPSIRGDVTFDVHPKRTVTNGTSSYIQTAVVSGASTNVTGIFNGATTTIATPSYDRGFYNGVQIDRSNTADNNVMFNLYYDFRNGSRLTPYIGGGVGMDFRDYHRIVTNSSKCANSTNSYLDPFTGNTVINPYAAGYCPSTLQTGFSSTTDKTVHSIGVAAAVMLGVTYDIAPGWKLDTGYRLLWSGAEVSLGSPLVYGQSTVSISDRLDHEVRTGVRIDLN